MTAQPASAPASLDIRRTLKWVRSHGFTPVKIRARDKIPVDAGWNSKESKGPTDDEWDRRDFNVGVILGPSRGGPVDIDLDSDEAISLAPHFLPPTDAVFGRDSRPRSHYLYDVRVGTPTVPFRDPLSKKNTLELRGDPGTNGGNQTVLPGSIHKSGESIRWYGPTDPTPSQVDPDALIRAVNRLALAVLVLRHIWVPSRRSDASVFLTGMLLKYEWTRDEIVHLFSAVSSAANYPDENHNKTISTIDRTVRKHANGSNVAGISKMRKEFDPKIVDEIAKRAGSEEVNVVAEYNDLYATVLMNNHFRIAKFFDEPSKPPIFIERADFIHLTEPEAIQFDDGKRIPKARIWLANPRRRQYDSVDFLPGEEDTGRTLNTWTGWAAPPVEGQCSAWLELLRTVICNNEDEVRWVLHWFAGILRHPTKKSMTALVIVGPQGAGKSMLLSYFGKILGHSYLSVTNHKHVGGNFNAHLANILLLHSEEALHGREESLRGTIKSIITDSKFTIERKGVDAVSADNHIWLVMTSNEEYAAPAEIGDRRFTIINMKDQNRKINPDLRDRVLAEMENDGPSALHHYLTTMEYDETLARTNIKNDALGEMKSLNLGAQESWWYAVLQSGLLLPDCLEWASSSKIPHDPWPPIVSSRALFTSFQLAIRDLNYRRPISETEFGLRMIKMLGRKPIKIQKNYINPNEDDKVPQLVRLLSARQNTYKDFPSLAECRAAMEKHVGQPLDWPDDMSEADKSAHDKLIDRKKAEQDEITQRFT